MFGGNVHIKFEVEKAKAAQLISDTGSNRSPKTSTGSVVRKEVSTSGFKIEIKIHHRQPEEQV